MRAENQNRLLRFLPSLTDAAFLLPLVFLFVRLSGVTKLLGDGDTGWHIRTGEWILQNGRVPVEDIFSFSKPGEPWFAWEWGWEVIFGWLHQHGGMAAVILASLLVLCSTFALLFRLVQRNCPNVLVAFGVTVLAIAGSAMHWLARPHLFTWLFVVVFLSLLERAREGRTRLLLWLPALMLLWTNLHGGFFVGVFLIGCYAAGELAVWLVEKDRTAARAALLRSKPYLATAAVCAAVTFANPYSYRLHLHIWQCLKEPWLFRYIDEFSATSFQNPSAVYFEPLLLLGVCATVWNLYQRRFAWAFMLTAWIHFALISARNVPIALIVCAPVVAGMLHALSTSLERSPLAPWINKIAKSWTRLAAEFGAMDRSGRVHLTSVLACGALCWVCYQPSPPPKFRSEYDPKKYPAKALAALQGPEFSRSIFATDLWGGYLIYKLYPSTKVFIDGRSDLYGKEFTEQYLSLINGKQGWERTFAKYGVDTVLLPNDSPLAGVLRESRRWCPTYEDGIAIVFRSEVALARDRTAKGSQASASSAVETGGRHNRDREITNFNQQRDPRITKSNTRSEST